MTQGIGNRSCTPTTSGRTVARPEHHQVLRATSERLRRLERYEERRVCLPEDQSPEIPCQYPPVEARGDEHALYHVGHEPVYHQRLAEVHLRGIDAVPQILPHPLAELYAVPDCTKHMSI